MGKASSAKKVARAARAGGPSRGERPKLTFPLTIIAVVILGALLVVYARTSLEPAEASEAPSYVKKDHWHAAYGVYVCDKYLAALPQSPEDKHGIHTHGDGVIHVHPFDASTSGSNARLGKFTDITWTDDGFTYAGTTYANGYDCGGKPARVVVYTYPADDPNAPAQEYTSNFANIAFSGDREAVTIAVIPEGAPLPPPPDSVKTLDNLTDVDNPTSGATGQVPGGVTGQIPGGLTDPSSGGVAPVDPAAGGAPSGAVTPGGAADPGAATPGGVTPGAATPSGAVDPGAATPSSTP